jgi:hypothetical protein
MIMELAAVLYIFPGVRYVANRVRLQMYSVVSSFVTSATQKIEASRN